VIVALMVLVTLEVVVRFTIKALQAGGFGPSPTEAVALLSQAIAKARRDQKAKPTEVNPGPFISTLQPSHCLTGEDMRQAVLLGGIIYTHTVGGKPRMLITIPCEVV
jgi:hypothetical protein